MGRFKLKVEFKGAADGTHDVRRSIVIGCARKWVEWVRYAGRCGGGSAAWAASRARQGPATARGISICRPDGGSRIDGPRRQSIWQRSDGVVLRKSQTSVRRSLVFGRRAREQLTSYTKLASFGDFGALRTYWSLPCGRSFFCKSSEMDRRRGSGQCRDTSHWPGRNIQTDLA
jgi:hypothetical protein